MSVRDAVAKRDDAASTAPAKVSPAVVVREAVERQAEAMRAVLPSHVDHERYARLILTAVKGTPRLMDCFSTPQGQTSILLAAMQAAAMGLEPNTEAQDCWILPRKNRGVEEAQLSIGYRGFLKLARRSATTASIGAEVVREGDFFEWSRGLEDTLVWKPSSAPKKDRPITDVYAVVQYKGGGHAFVVLTAEEVYDEHRAMSDSWKNTSSRPYSPWTNHEAAMFRKTALRALTPYLDLSAEDLRLAQADAVSFEIDRSTGEIQALADTMDPGELVAGSEEDPDVDEPQTLVDDGPAADLEGGDAPPEPTDAPSSAEDEGSAAEDHESTEADLEGDPEVEVVSDEVGPMTEAQSKRLHTSLRTHRGAAGPGRFPVLTEILGREVTAMGQVTNVDAEQVIDTLTREGENNQ